MESGLQIWSEKGQYNYRQYNSVYDKVQDKEYNLRSTIICQKVKFFTPIDGIQVSSFSDYGVYKPIKQMK